MRLSLEACVCVCLSPIARQWETNLTQGRELSTKKNSHSKHITQEGSLGVVYILKPDG